MTIAPPIIGTILLSADYQRIYPTPANDLQRNPRWVEGWIYFHELTSGDEVTVKFYEYDDQGQQHRIYDIPVVFSSVASTPACHLGAVLSDWIRIDVAQTAGSPNYKNINYKFYEVT